MKTIYFFLHHVNYFPKGTLVKGSEVLDNSVVAARAMATKSFTNENCLIGGAPAKELKVGSINYHRKKFNIDGFDVLSSFRLFSIQIAISLNRYARITLSLVYNLTSKIVQKSAKANL